jgi:Domain of unknown function DUF11/Peptidase S24-like
MRVSEPIIRKDSRLFEELCSAVLRRGNAVQFRVHGRSMSPNIADADEVVIAPANAGELHPGDVVLARNTDGLRVHRVASFNFNTVDISLRSDTGLESDPTPTQIFGKVVRRHHRGGKEAFTPFQTRFVHPLRIYGRRLGVAAQLRLRRLGVLTGIVVLTLLCAALVAPAAHAQTADLQLTQTASAQAVAAGSNYTYTETVKNNTSSATVTTGTITVYMQTPANTTYQSYAGTNWNCTNPGANGIGPIVCTYNTTLASGATANSLTVTFKVAQWRANVNYAVGTRIVDSNGNVEQVVTAGKSAGAQPTWNTTLGG